VNFASGLNNPVFWEARSARPLFRKFLHLGLANHLKSGAFLQLYGTWNSEK
jgi:hypothetical protein